MIHPREQPLKVFFFGGGVEFIYLSPLLTTLLQFIEVCEHLLIHSTLKIPLKHFSHARVWMLAGPLHHLDSFLCSSSVGDLLMHKTFSGI